MKMVVSVIYTQGGGPARKFVRLFGVGDVVVPMNTADAICLTLDELEADGVAMDAVTGLAIVAKAGPGADALLPVGHPARTGYVEEVQPCAA
ncbi:MAG: hypothetical protein ACH37Z_15575 [Anaerolineae bacterium]